MLIESCAARDRGNFVRVPRAASTLAASPHRSFAGDPAPIVQRAHDAGALVVRRSAPQEARAAGTESTKRAQGWESGGHVRRRRDDDAVPAVVDAVEVPASRGRHGDGRGVAAALARGADDAWPGPLRRSVESPHATRSGSSPRARRDAEHDDSSSPRLGLAASRPQRTALWRKARREAVCVPASAASWTPRLSLSGQGAGLVHRVRPPRRSHFTLDAGGRKRPACGNAGRAVDVALEPPAEDALEPARDLDERVEVDARSRRPRARAARRDPRSRRSRSPAARTGSRRGRRPRRREPSPALERGPRGARSRCSACCARGSRPACRGSRRARRAAAPGAASRRRSCPRGRARRASSRSQRSATAPGSTSPSNGQPNAHEIVTVAGRPVTSCYLRERPAPARPPPRASRSRCAG